MNAGQKRANKQKTRRKRKVKEQQVAVKMRNTKLRSDRFPVHACLVNEHWREEGKASIYLARTIAPRRVTFAAFLVDTWAMGLKDAWGRVDIPLSGFLQDMDAVSEDLTLCRIDIDSARHLVYGGVELAKEIGFRLPRQYDRWTSVLGSLPEGQSPDMTLFRKDNKLLIVCSGEDLRKRYIGGRIEDLLARDDVDYQIGDDGFTLVDDEADQACDIEDQFVAALLDDVRKHCFANGEVPHPMLPHAAVCLMAVIAETMATGQLDDDVDLDDPMQMPTGEWDDLVSRLDSFAALGSPDPAGSRAALDQLARFLGSAGSPDRLSQIINADSDDRQSPHFPLPEA